MIHLMAALVFSLSSFAQENEECSLALVEALGGNSIVVTPQGEKSEVEENASVQPGDLIATGKDAWVDLRLCDGTGLRVGELSKFYYEGPSQERESFLSWAMRLAQGNLFANVASTEGGKGDRVKLRVKTPNAALGVRGTEFVVDADFEKETSLHTFEGEVLIGPAEGFDALADVKPGAKPENFETVGKEQMSHLRRGEARPLRAAAFKAWEFRQERGALFRRVLQKRGWTEIRQRFQDAHKRWKDRRGARGLFERPREKVERVLERRQQREDARQERAAEKLAAPVDRRGERAQERLSEHGNRREKLQERMEERRQKRLEREHPDAWKKNVHGLPASPRHPNLPYGRRRGNRD